jgi:hypothetical protein
MNFSSIRFSAFRQRIAIRYKKVQNWRSFFWPKTETNPWLKLKQYVPLDIQNRYSLHFNIKKVFLTLIYHKMVFFTDYFLEFSKTNQVNNKKIKGRILKKGYD